jgi:hypothetical protein
VSPGDPRGVRKITAGDVNGFLVHECARVSPGSAGCFTYRLRSLLRYLAFRGVADPGLALAYRVFFGENNVSACIYSATLAAVQNGPTLEQPPAGRITVANDPDPRAVLVKTYDAAGSPVEAPFHLIVAC